MIKRPVLPVLWVLIAGILIARYGHLLPGDRAGTNDSELVEDGAAVTVRGMIYRIEQKTGSYYLYLQDISLLKTSDLTISKGASPQIQTLSQKLILVTTEDIGLPGEYVEAVGEVGHFANATNEGNFDEKAYYRSRGIGMKVWAEKTEVTGENTGIYWWSKRNMYRLNGRISEFYGENCSEKQAGVLNAIVLGDRSHLPEQLKENFQADGISHVLAISGLHVSVVGMGVFHLCRKRRGYGISVVAGGFTLFLFYLMSGGSTSTLRATVMAVLFLLSAYLGRAYEPYTALAIACILLLVQNPWVLWDAGFLFSVSAVLGAFLMSTYIHRYYERLHPLFQTLMVSMSVQLMTIPLTAWYYYEVPLWSIPANLLILPLMAPLLCLGLLGGVCGTLVPVVGVKIGEWLLAPAGIIIDMMAALPRGTVIFTGKPRLWQMVTYYIILMTCYYIVLKRNRLKLAFVMALTALFIFAPNERKAQLVMLDVGQGDGIYITDGKGLDIMIDGGSTDVKQVGQYRILPFLKSRRVKCVDYWFVSHLDADHYSGLVELAESGYRIGCIVISSEMPEDEEREELLSLAMKKQIPVKVLERGEQLEGASMSIQNLTIPQKASDDKNSTSMVLRVEMKSGLSAIFAGDIGADEEIKLAESGDIRRADILKANHHGSDGSNSEIWMQQTHPFVTVISCGEDNRYGHPGAEAVARMEDVGTKIFCTMESGQIAIGKEDGKIWVKEYIRK